jgi:hypothetical protein
LIAPVSKIINFPPSLFLCWCWYIFI